MDHETEERFQSLLETDFKGCTILAVMHKFRYVQRYDRVVVMKQGRVVECDAPESLLRREGSEFAKLYQASLSRDEGM